MNQARRNGLPIQHIIIFITGAGTLALELLSSRILTPYFGVSLYIWSSILAITLTFLAIGYFAGGWLAARGDGEWRSFAFYAAPAASALAIVVACLAYPWTFRWLAGADLLFGCIIAATLLLAVPLVVLSAMNPLLIALRPTVESDAGAGRVFFVSTLGSVAGVLVTAFLLIPNMTNFRSLLLIAIILAAMPVAGLVTLTVQHRRAPLLAVACLGLLPAIALFALAPSYLGKSREIVAGDYRFKLRTEYSSIFGNLKVVEFADRYDPSRYVVLFLNDGLVQNQLAPDGTSQSEYTYVLEALAAAYAHEATTALVLGLGAGVLPRSLAKRGIAVDVVEINPDMVAAVLQHVEAEPGWTVQIGDARTFTRSCRQRYDVIVIDLFHGDGTPDYLLSADFFADVRRCLAPDGTAVMNAFAAERESANYRHLLATVRSAFTMVADFHRPAGADGPNLNAYIVAATGPRKPMQLALTDVPQDLLPHLVDTLRSLSRVTDAGDAAPVFDEFNIFSILNAADQMMYRRILVQQLPAEMLVN